MTQAPAISVQCPYGNSQAWSERKIREYFVQSLPTCSNHFHLWEKFHGAECCLIAQSLHVCDRKILIKSDTYDQHQIYYS